MSYSERFKKVEANTCPVNEVRLDGTKEVKIKSPPRK